MSSTDPTKQNSGCSALLTGCSNHESQNGTSITLSDIDLLFPATWSVTISEELENGASFEFEGWWGELRDDRLVVMGRDYGELNAGDKVEFKSDETVIVNGSRREPAGIASIAVDHNGIVFYFPGRSVSRSTNEGHAPIVTLPGGDTCELTPAGIIIDGHEYGPYAAGTVVKIASNGSVAFNP